MERFVNIFNELFDFRDLLPKVSERQCKLKYDFSSKKLCMLSYLKIEIDEQKNDYEWSYLSDDISYLITLGTLRFISDSDHKRYFDVWDATGCEEHFSEKIYEWIIDMENVHDDYVSDICDKVNTKGLCRYNTEDVDQIYLTYIHELTQELTKEMNRYKSNEMDPMYGY